MNRLMDLALSLGETLVHEGGRLLFGVALGRAKEFLVTPQQIGTRQLALNRALQKKQWMVLCWQSRDCHYGDPFGMGGRGALA